MKRALLLIAVFGLILAYSYPLEQMKWVDTPLYTTETAPGEVLSPKTTTQDPEHAPNLKGLSEAGYCGARLPKGFKRPTLAKMLNSDSSQMGNTARKLYNQRQSSDLERHLRAWEESDATSPHPSLWQAVLHLENQMPAHALPYLAKALSNAQDKAPIALFLGNILSHTPDLEPAIDALTIYLKSYPQDRPKMQELARLETQHEIQSRYERIEENGIELLYPPEADQLDWASFLTQIDTKIDEAADFTGTPRRQTLTVIAFEGKAELLASTCVPIWTGGVYDGSIKLAMHNATRLPSSVTVAHEALHAQLSYSVLGEIPAWFSEGMAQAFAHEENRAQSSWRKMVKHQTYIPFTSLGDSFLEFEGSEDARLAYHQGLAMVLWLYDDAGAEGLHQAVKALQLSKQRQKRLLDIFFAENEPKDFLEFVGTLVD